jgi:uncharacterized FAD-dependent dehydrogenase
LLRWHHPQRGRLLPHQFLGIAEDCGLIEAIDGRMFELSCRAMADAVLTVVETRTPSPLRIPRDERKQSCNTRGLYPAGEGAGYAGGILSAAVDGIRVAEALALDICATAA